MTEIKAENHALERWDEMVFQNRNKDYGAFIIRQLYAKHVFRGLVMTVSVLVLLILLPYIVSLFRGSDVPDFMTPQMVIQVELTSPPPIEKNTPAKLATVPSVKAVDKFLPPEVVKEEVIIKEPPPVEEVKHAVDPNATEDGSVTGTENGEGTDVIYDVVERKAFFVGGEKAMHEFLTTNTRYPLTAMRARLNGTVFVSFFINPDGSIDEVHAIRGFFKDCDKEAERVVRTMPRWEPALQGGKPIRSQFSVKVIFQLGTASQNTIPQN